MRIGWLFVLLGATVFTRTLPAQAAGAVLVQGVRAYDDLDFDAAAGLLRRALAAEDSGGLAPSERERAMMYLVATELLREHRDTARAVARRLVVANPRFRPDELVFPPRVLQLYGEARRTTPAILALSPADTAFRPGGEALGVRLYASTVHDVRATLVALDGSILRTLYSGPISDSLVIHWDGRDSSGAQSIANGRYAIAVSSLDPARHVVRIVRVPLEVLPGGTATDTLAAPLPPADTMLRAERQPFGPALHVLAPGLLAGAAIAVLPGALSHGVKPSGGRLVIGVAVSGLGIAAFVSRHPRRALPENVAHNRAIAEWHRAVAQVARRNAERSHELIHVRTETPMVISP
jgi:hypothetical protein